jgi:hypothetical protein
MLREVLRGSTTEKPRGTYEFKADFPHLVRPEATERLLRTILAYNRWTRKKTKGVVAQRRARLQVHPLKAVLR